MKNKFMRVAIIMMALVLVTSCFVGSTFAKYITDADGADNARVALFGVELSAEDGAFATTYALEDTLETNAVITNSVSSSDADKLVAPGTDGAFSNITMTGTPEVAVRVTYAATVELSNWYINTDEYYCPIVITVGTEEIYGLDYSSAADFATAIEDEITGYTAEYAPGTDLSAVDGADLALSWAWAFEGSDQLQTDEKDTLIGNIGADTISIDVSVTVEQID